MHFCDKDAVRRALEGKTVALVGSGPGSLKNEPGLVDSHNVVVRVNNYKLFAATGRRTDIFYSFFGSSVKKTAEELKQDGVKLCMCKCPDTKFIESEWHRKHGKANGVDFRYIYERRKDWWFCDTYVPSLDEFMTHFSMLGGHVPTTGFSALLDVLSYNPRRVYVTGFDFFTSKVHNVNEPWSRMNKADPIGHVPNGEMEWFAANVNNLPIVMDTTLKFLIRKAKR